MSLACLSRAENRERKYALKTLPSQCWTVLKQMPINWFGIFWCNWSALSRPVEKGKLRRLYFRRPSNSSLLSVIWMLGGKWLNKCLQITDQVQNVDIEMRWLNDWNSQIWLVQTCGTAVGCVPNDLFLWPPFLFWLCCPFSGKDLKVKASCGRSFGKTRDKEAAETYPFSFPVTGPSGSEFSIGERSKNP